MLVTAAPSIRWVTAVSGRGPDDVGIVTVLDGKPTSANANTPEVDDTGRLISCPWRGNRSKSPISAARPTAKSVSIPRRQRSLATVRPHDEPGASSAIVRSSCPDGSRACRSRRGSPAASPAPRRREPAPAATTSSAGSTCSRCPRKGCRGVAAWRAAGGRASDRRGRLGARTRARSASSLIVGTLTGRIASIINRRSTRSASERDETTPGSAAIPAAMHSPRSLEAPTCER